MATSAKVGLIVIFLAMPVMNCLFDNPKSSRFFPRLQDEEECLEGDLNCMGIVFCQAGLQGLSPAQPASG